jgi:cation diffusion facilitator family transporter
MHAHTLGAHQHEHAFGTEERSGAERRTVVVVALTAAMMVVEIVAGLVFRSMALLADGWHMASHAAALSVAVFAYRYARSNARNERYSFGTGKVGALGGFASAVALAVIAILVLGESALRFASPAAIRFDQAIPVAVVGLVVNLVCALLLREEEHDHHEHRDHNLRGAYLHVIADALTSVLAIGALVTGKLMGWAWTDPAIGIVGSLVIAKWSYGLLRDSSRVLLDAEASPEKRERVRRLVEGDGDDRVADLHLWRVGPRHFAAILSVVTRDPRDPAHYRELLAGEPDLAHVTVEVVPCRGESCSPPSGTGSRG